MAKNVNLSLITGLVKDKSLDFTDNGLKIKGYLYKNLIPVSYLRLSDFWYHDDGGEKLVHFCQDDIYIRIHQAENISFEEYQQFPSYALIDKFNGVNVDEFDGTKLTNILEQVYQDLIAFKQTCDFITDDEVIAFQEARSKSYASIKKEINDIVSRMPNTIYDELEFAIKLLRQYDERNLVKASQVIRRAEMNKPVDAWKTDPAFIHHYNLVKATV